MDNQEANTHKHTQTLISMSWLQSTLQKKKIFLRQLIEMEQEVRSPTTLLTDVIRCSQTLGSHQNNIHLYLVLSFRKITKESL